MGPHISRILAPLALILIVALYAELLIHAPAHGQDFRVFYAAATILHEGGNPYDPGRLLRVEQRLYQPHTRAEEESLAGNPYVQGPPLAGVLTTWSGHPERVAVLYYVEALLLLLSAVMALLILARAMPVAQPAGQALILLLSPVTFVGILLGQVDALLLLLLSAALTLSRRRPLIAGLLLTLGLFKPQIMAGPVILFGLLSWRHQRLREYASGVGIGLLLFVGASIGLAGSNALIAWGRELIRFGGATVYAQVDISSLSTLYVAWAPRGLSTIFLVLGLLLWSVVCAGSVRHVGDYARDYKNDNATRIIGEGEETDERWWLLCSLAGWLLVTPYAHPHDDVLLLPAAWALMAQRPYHGRLRVLAILLALTWWLLPMTSLFGLRPPGIRGLGLFPVLLLFALLIVQRPTFREHFSHPNSPIAPHPIVS